jgi:mono/diheme cytochrome c family protein
VTGLPIRVRSAIAAAAALAVAVWLSGCENSFEYARYPKDLRYPVRTDLVVVDSPASDASRWPAPGRLDEGVKQAASAGGKVVDPNQIPSDLRAAMQEALTDLFGTPHSPQVGSAAGDDEEVVKQVKDDLKLRDDSNHPFAALSRGSALYRRHCVHCHGLTGDGRGPTGPWIDPFPRDYRSGKFKFISTDPNKVANRKPRREDLLRTLHTGVEGTAMPSFGILPEEDLNDLASYVMHLSIRGEVEYQLVTNSPAGNGTYTTKDDIAQAAHDELLPSVVKMWADSEANLYTPAKDSYKELTSKEKAESIRRGYELFSDPSKNAKAGCILCHVDYGRQSALKYDKWDTIVRPMNLTSGVYRGGRRPIDVFWRIRCGIDPSNMPANKPDTGMKDDKDVWDVVNFVQALPYPQMLPSDVREKVYGRVAAKPSAERAEN